MSARVVDITKLRKRNTTNKEKQQKNNKANDDFQPARAEPDDEAK
jgi:hypothetical protein